MSKENIHRRISTLSVTIVFIINYKCCFGDATTAPLSTKDFFKQIYGNVCPSGELSCLREVMTESYQLSLARISGVKVRGNAGMVWKKARKKFEGVLTVYSSTYDENSSLDEN